MNTRNIMVVVGIIILGLVAFFFMRQKTEAPTVLPVAGGSAVNIDNYKFNPNALAVKKGTTVTWTNNDGATHTVTSSGSTGPASEIMASGQTYSYTFDTIGTYDYYCNLHPSMKGTVSVTE